MPSGGPAPIQGAHTPPSLRATSPNLGEDLSSPSKVEGVARRAGGVCPTATMAPNSPPKLGGVAEGRGSVPSGGPAPTQGAHTPPSLRATSPNLGEELPL